MYALGKDRGEHGLVWIIRARQEVTMAQKIALNATFREVYLAPLVALRADIHENLNAILSDASEFSAMLAATVEVTNLNSQDIANRLGCTRAAVSKWINGSAAPRATREILTQWLFVWLNDKILEIRPNIGRLEYPIFSLPKSPSIRSHGTESRGQAIKSFESEAVSLIFDG
jgi:transcriptional regulator with XRE-family HTH domain